MSKGIDRITALVNTANDTLKEGKTIVETAEQGWSEIKAVFSESQNLVTNVKSKYEELKKKFESENAADKLLAVAETKQAIEDIMKEVNDIKDKVLDIYNKAKDIKESIDKIRDNLGFVLAELNKWKEIKKEIEEQLVEAKIEILRAVETCKKLAASKYQEAKAGLDGLISKIGNMDMTQMTKAAKKELLKAFEKVMEDYDWWTSGGEEQVKDLKKAIKKSVTDDLERLLDGAISYVEQSKSWQRVERLSGAIKQLQQTLDGIFNKAQGEEIGTQSLTRQLSVIGEGLIEMLGDKATEFFGDLIKPAGPAFDLVGKFLKAYKLADSTIEAVKNFPEGLDNYLPKTFKKDFIDWNKELFNYSVSIPIVSLGWINLTAGAGLKSVAAFKLSGEVTFYNTFKPAELRVLDASLTANGSISLTGHVSLGVNLLAIVEAKAKAKLTAEGKVNEAKADVNILRKLSGDAQNGAFKLGTSASLSFEIFGELSFSVGLTSALRTIVKWFTDKDPVKEWSIGTVSLFYAQTSKSFNTELKFEAVEFDFSEIKAMLKDVSTYRLSSKGRKAIEESMEEKLGKRDKWEEYASGAKLTENEIEQLRAKYGQVGAAL
jgi:hypothetical protein